MVEQMESLRRKLNDLVEKENILYEGEILALSQELDELISNYYLNLRSA